MGLEALDNGSTAQVSASKVPLDKKQKDAESLGKTGMNSADLMLRGQWYG